MKRPPTRSRRSAGSPALAAGGRAAADLHAGLAERWTRFGLTGRAQRGPRARGWRCDPTQDALLEQLGGAAIDAGDWPRAEELHRALLRVRPRDVDAQLRLAAVLTRQAKWAEARQAFERARSLDPSAPVDPQVLAYVAARATSP